MNHWTTRTGILLGVAVLSLSSAVPAQAGDDEMIKRGNCSGATDWKLKVKTDDGRLEVEGEVDSNRNGQHWAWRIVHDGSVSARGTATTRGASGSFSIERRVVDGAGTDRIGWRAVNRGSGETCRGGLTY